MRLGVIADIHADLAALRLALAFLDDQQADSIVCAGDIMQKGPDDRAVVELLKERGIPCIAGNHDRAARSKLALDDEVSNYLRELPPTLTFTLEDKRILVTHAAPWSDLVYVFPTAEKHVFKRFAYEVNADIVLLGHTHVPMAAHVRQVWIYNPGSVCGAHTSGSRTCGILSLPDCSFEVFDIESRAPVEIAQIRIVH